MSITLNSIQPTLHELKLGLKELKIKMRLQLRYRGLHEKDYPVAMLV